MNPRTRISLALILIVLAVASAYVYVSTFGPTPAKTPLTRPCAGSTEYVSLYDKPNWSVACGIQNSSDGRLRISLHNYRYDEADHINFQVPPNSNTLVSTDVFLLANVTIWNVGPGNVDINAGWYAVFKNLTSPVSNGGIAQAMPFFGNGLFIINASFPGQLPNASLPAIDGGLNLPPGERLNCWLIFFVPNVTLSVAKMGAIQLEQVAYFEHGYGGQYLGHGGYSGSQYVDTELVVVSQP